jgi:hypothetical protein
LLAAQRWLSPKVLAAAAEQVVEQAVPEPAALQQARAALAQAASEARPERMAPLERTARPERTVGPERPAPEQRERTARQALRQTAWAAARLAQMRAP